MNAYTVRARFWEDVHDFEVEAESLSHAEEVFWDELERLCQAKGLRVPPKEAIHIDRVFNVI